MTERSRDAAVVGCALAVLTLVLLPCVVTFLPAIYFDVDPRSDVGRSAVVALGPAGAAWYQTAAVAVAALSLAVSVAAGARVRWAAAALVGVGMLACAYHLPQHTANALPTGGWIAAAALGLAAVHLGQFEPARRWLVAGLVAMLVPMGLQAGWYVLVEHPATVASYLETESEMLASRGWEAGSSQHELYRRRLMDWQAVGTFGLSNVFGSVVAGFTLLAAAVMVDMGRRTQWQWALMALPVAGLGMVTVWLSRSAGAMVGLLAGAGVLGIVGLVRVWGMGTVRLKPHGLGRWVMVGVVALVGLAFAAVLVRGAMGPPETMAGERTLLFRFHYWQAAARLIGEALPGSAVVGVGPHGFSQGYLWAKNPLNPEEVTNAHNVFIDYVVMLGIGGWALAAVLWLWLMQAGMSVGRGAWGVGREESGEPGGMLPREHLVLAGVVAAAVFGVQYRLMLPQLMIETALLWLVAALAFVGVMAVLATPGRLRPWWGMAGLLAAATAVLVHNQIEMTFYQFTSAGIVWVIVGLAAAGDVQAKPATAGRAWARFGPAAALAAAVVALAVGHAAPVTAQQGRLARAATALQQGHAQTALARLDQAGAASPTDADVRQWRLSLRLSIAQQAAAMRRTDLARQQIADALAVLDASEAAGVDTASLHRQRARVQLMASEMLDEPDRLDAAATAWQQAIVRAPYNLDDHVQLGDLHWRRGERERAAELYRRALQISDWNYLDPAKQLTDAQRLTARARADTAQESEPVNNRP
ncbi:MAG: hypothetical protein WD534_00530 [Phycisphaeraceae bacterium]